MRSLFFIVFVLAGCAHEQSVIKTCGTNQYWPAGDQMALAEQISPYKIGQPVRNLNDDWYRMRCENLACQKGYDVCKERHR